MDAKQQRDLVRRLLGAGYTVERVGNRRHVRQDGNLLVVLPGSTKNVEPHAWRNALAILRTRTGIDGRPRRHRKAAHA